MVDNDAAYLQIFFNRLEVCKRYQPKFGLSGQGVSFQDFRTLYGADAFYHWIGLDNPFVYAAHKASGGITSLYRQIGLASEELFRQILVDTLNLMHEQVSWSYTVAHASGQARQLSLDGKIALQDIPSPQHQQRIRAWLERASARLSIQPDVARALRGIVFEVRQGYKSKDAKRQNADLANAAQAYTQGYLPVLLVLSGQIDVAVVERYVRNKWLVLTGSTLDDSLASTYAFVADVVGYPLAAFFVRNSALLRQYMIDLLAVLLKVEDAT